MSSTAASTSSWSSVGGVATCASPAKTTSPTRRSVRRLVEERTKCFLRGPEPRRLDVLRLHRPRRVDDEDDGGLLLQEAALDLRSSKADEEHARPSDEKHAGGTSLSHERPETTVAKHVEVRVANRVASTTAIAPESQIPTNAGMTSRPSSIHGLWKLIATSRNGVDLDDGANARELGIAANASRRHSRPLIGWRAGKALDEARARRRPGREAERVRPADEPLAARCSAA